MAELQITFRSITAQDNCRYTMNKCEITKDTTNYIYIIYHRFAEFSKALPVRKIAANIVCLNICTRNLYARSGSVQCGVPHNQS